MVPAATPVTDAENLKSEAAAELVPFSISELSHAENAGAATTAAGAVTVQRAAGKKSKQLHGCLPLQQAPNSTLRCFEVTTVANCH